MTEALSTSAAFEEALRSLEAELSSPAGRDDRAREACERLRGERGAWSRPEHRTRLVSLASLATRRAGSLVEGVAAFLLEVAEADRDPWPFLERLLAAPGPRTSRATLELAARLAGQRRLALDAESTRGLATLVDAPGSPLAEPEAIPRVARLLRPPAEPEGEEGAETRLLSLYTAPGEPALRRLAARVLDLPAAPPSPKVMSAVLGDAPARVLGPYLEYTRATHLDLLDLTPEPGSPPPCLEPIRRAEDVCGAPALREILAALGWRRVCWGLTVQALVGVSVGGSFPLVLRPSEAQLLEGYPGARRVLERWLVVAHGGALRWESSSGASADHVNRFRSLNLLHADALADILDVAPLTVGKVERILDRMDRIVVEFRALFAERAAGECAVVADVHEALRRSVRRELDARAPGRPLSAELTRLVQMFEDPRSAGEVRTLHGLKRYLHQKGLQLGFRLAEAGRGSSRTVDMAIVTPGHPIHPARVLEYLDFEPEPDAATGDLGIPWTVWIAADAFARQLIHGQERLPKLRAFCYGNEVHYYLYFANHPLFLRVDFAPPLRGGMLDLEYYGVSKHELNVHPNPALDGIARVLGRLDLDVQVDATRIHARYDKERAVDLTELCARVEALFRLAPYLMDVDWVLGDLQIPAGARPVVADAWAAFFERWGVLPLPQLLTADRLGILRGVEAGAAGPEERRWDGRGAYRDRFTVPPDPGIRAFLNEALEALGLPLHVEEGGHALAQLDLERELLVPLRAAIERGEVRETAEGLRPCPSHLFERRHEATWMAELLEGRPADLPKAARVARLASALERHLRFQTTGTVNGYEVQQAALPLRGQTIGLYGLRDAAGVLRLACFTRDGALYRARDGPGAAWRENARLDPEELETLLRRSNLTISRLEREDALVQSGGVADTFRSPNPYEAAPRLPGERVVPGIAAAPGRAAGPARLGISGREPADVEDAVLVAASVRPEDAPLLSRSAAVVSSGGGVLSHAGLLAMQLGKPALVAGGRWESPAGAAPSLVCRRVEHVEEERPVGAFRVVEYHERREREDRIGEGDLLVVDADAGVLCLFGQDRDALAFHEGLRQLGVTARRLREARDDGEILTLRGRRLRARHLLERLLSRLEDPVLARHAARELLSGGAGGGTEAELLSRLLTNPAVGEATRAAVRQIAGDLTRRHAAVREEAERAIPGSRDAHEVLTLRRDVRRLGEQLAIAQDCLSACGLATATEPSGLDLDALASRRLHVIREDLLERVRREASQGQTRSLRHPLELLARLDLVLGPGDGATTTFLEDLRRHAAEEDAAARGRLGLRLVVGPEDGGFELQPVVGSKAAALAEGARMGEGALIPGWFVVTDAAFQRVLEAPASAPPNGANADAPTLGAVIQRVLGRDDATLEERAAAIRRAWQAAALPGYLVDSIAEAYHRLSEGPCPEDRFVAIRSSACEEDTEVAARAGEFDTFLFVRGLPSVLEHLRLAWAGLWSARALHGRALLKRSGPVRGGVLVQRMVDARASGVLHTLNVAAGRPREMLINAGLGLGEGVVSGLVAADQITVEKDAALSGEDLHFRYLTRDKRERVVFNARAGTGTSRVETLYHQRLRPALEYVELCQLVHAAARLETAWGHPLDIEFALDTEGADLRLLQVRPVPAALAVWRETADRYPFKPGGSP